MRISAEIKGVSSWTDADKPQILSLFFELALILVVISSLNNDTGALQQGAHDWQAGTRAEKLITHLSI